MKRRPIACGRTGSSSSAGRRAGVTLLELLVTIGLVLLVVVLAGATLLNGASSATMARLRAEQEAELLRVMAAMRRQIITLSRSSATRTPVVGEIGREPDTDWLDMVTSSLMFTKGVGRAEWRIIRVPGEPPYLAYRESPWVGGERLHDHAWMPFSRLVTGLRVRYWSNPQFVEGWKREEIPQRIEVTLLYNDEGVERQAAMQAFPGIADEGSASPPTAGASPTAAPGTAPSSVPTGQASASPNPSPSGGATR